MSGICGLFQRDRQPADARALYAMMAVLAHRGPDATGTWADGPMALGHLMLHTTPESLQEKLPLTGGGGNLILTADARIDNRPELLSHFDFAGRPPAEIADSELILAAYEKWGEHCPEKLTGDFAFAIWDQANQRLFCARDPMGVRPFYYHISPRLFAFASEIKALFCLPDVPRAINPRAIAYYMAALEDDKIITFYEGIVRLPPAHTLTVDTDGLRLRRYWELDPHHEIRLPSDGDYAEAFREVFAEAVRCRLRSAFPLSSMLSGGLDSSSVVSMARKLLNDARDPQPLHTYSAIFPSLPEKDLRVIDERRFIDAVTTAAGIEAHAVHADRIAPLADLDHSLWHQDGLFFGPTMYIEEALTAAAQRDGVRIMLDGMDGDTTISHGWQRLPELAITGRWWQLIQEVNAHKRVTGQEYSRKAVILHMAFLPLVPFAVRRGWQQLRGQSEESPWASRPINPELARAVGFDSDSHVQDTLKLHAGHYRGARAEHISGLEFSINAMVMELMNKSKAAYGLEARHPFFDRRLIEFCVALPSSQKLGQGWDRIVLRRGMEGILPPSVQWRTDKGDLSMNFRRHFLDDEQNVIQEIFDQPQLVEPYINLPLVKASYDDYLKNPMYGSDHLFALYLTAMLYRWLRWLDFDFNATRPEQTRAL